MARIHPCFCNECLVSGQVGVTRGDQEKGCSVKWCGPNVFSPCSHWQISSISIHVETVDSVDMGRRGEKGDRVWLTCRDRWL